MATDSDRHPEDKTSHGPPLAKGAGDFTLRKAIFEVAIVAVGVLLALIVDEARDRRADQTLAEEVRTAMRSEIDQNRVRLASKLKLLHDAYRTLEQDGAAGPRLVANRSNFQITLTDAAWMLAIQTGALRLLPQEERQALAYVYTSHEIYNRLLSEEMTHWTALSAAAPGDGSIKLWKAYGERVAGSICITAIRVERFRNPDLPTGRRAGVCQRYRLSTPPAVLYRQLGFELPDTSWRPGGEY